LDPISNCFEPNRTHIRSYFGPYRAALEKKKKFCQGTRVQPCPGRTTRPTKS